MTPMPPLLDYAPSGYVRTTHTNHVKGSSRFHATGARARGTPFSRMLHDRDSGFFHTKHTHVHACVRNNISIVEWKERDRRECICIRAIGNTERRDHPLPNKLR